MPDIVDSFIANLLVDSNLLLLAAPPAFGTLLLVWLLARIRRRKRETGEGTRSATDTLRSAIGRSTDDSIVSSTPTSLQDNLHDNLQDNLWGGLAKSRKTILSRISEIFSRESPDSAALFDQLEELLLTADLGVATTNRLLERLRLAGRDKAPSEAEFRELLRREITAILATDSAAEIHSRGSSGHPFVVVVVGVNGVGKTTTVGKLAARIAEQGARVVLGACDTFRAAAHQQLEVWAKRAGAEIVAGAEGDKPSTVAFRTLERAKSGGFDTVIIDTAGRLHTKVSLMNELKAVHALISRELGRTPDETILVVDATTGQNALQQARDFHAAVNLTGIVVTKLDGTPKGGIVIAIKNELGIPIRYLGVGERLEDLLPFSAEQFTEGLLADHTSESEYITRVSRKRRLNEP